jgi:hypoxanthine phosphoribosyltransferase
MAAASLRVAQGLNREFQHTPLLPPPVLAPVLSGAFRFVGEVLQHIQFAYTLVPVKVGSYGTSLKTSGEPVLELGCHLPVEGAEVVLLEDVVESGHTIRHLVQHFLAKGAKRVRVATMLFKPEAYLNRNPDAVWEPEWIGMEIPDAFVVGHGLDYAEQGRHLHGLYSLVVD